MLTKFEGVNKPVQASDVLMKDLGRAFDPGDVLFDALETEGIVYVVNEQDIERAKDLAGRLNDELDFEINMIVDHIKKGVHTVERYEEQGLADDVMAYIKNEIKEMGAMRKGTVKVSVENKQNENMEVVEMMKAAGLEVGMVIETKLGTLTVKGFNATAEGVMVAVKPEGAKVVEIHASKLKGLMEAQADQGTSSVKVAFEGQSQVPVSESAEEKALARIEEDAKKVVNNQTKTQGENKMTNKTLSNAEMVANLGAAKEFMKNMGGKLAGAQKPVAKKEETTTNKNETKGAVKMNSVKIGATNNGLNKSNATKKENGAMVNNKAAVNNGGLKSSGTGMMGNGTGLKSAGSVSINFGAAAAKTNAGQRMDWNDSVRGNNNARPEAPKMPWYLNAANYPALNDIVEVLVNRKHTDLGITAINLLNPKTELAYANDNIKAIVEVVFGKGLNLRFRIEENVYEGSADLRSSNVAWEEKWNAESFRKELTPVYAFARKNTVDITVECCGVKYPTTAGSEVECKKCGAKHTVNAEAAVSHEVNGEEAASKFNMYGWTKQTLGNFNIDVDKNVIAVAMAFAQFALGYEMHGLLTVEQEDVVMDALSK